MKTAELTLDIHLNAKSEKKRLSQRIYDKKNFHISLKQLRILHAVHEYGGFGEAGEHLYLSQSTISYTIAKLQEQLSIEVFKLEGRRATLTDAGRIILQRSRRLLKEALEFETFTSGLLKGLCSSIYLMVENDFPERLLKRAIQQFSAIEPEVSVSLGMLCKGKAANLLAERPLSLAICSWTPERLVSEPFIALDYVPVAHAAHPLAKQACPLKLSDLHQSLQLVIGELAAAPSRNVPSAKDMHNYRTVPDLYTALEALSGGVGYAWVPKDLIATDFWERNLKILPMHEIATYKKQFYLVRHADLAHDSMLARLSNILKTDIACHKAYTAQSR